MVSAAKSIGAVLVAAGLVLALPAAADGQCALVAKASLPVLPGIDAVTVIPTHIDDKATWMMIDTGAIRSMVQGHAADQMGFAREALDSNLNTAQSLTTTPAPVVAGRSRRGGGGGVAVQPSPSPQINTDEIALLNRRQIEAFSVYGLGGKPIREQTRGHAVRLGALGFTDASFLIIPDILGEKSEVAGMIGMDLLRDYDIEFDMAGHFVNLFSPDHCAGNVVYWAKEYLSTPIEVNRDGQVLLDVKLDGKTVRALLDTGSSETTLDQAVASWRFDVTPETEGVTKVGDTRAADGSVLTSYEYQFKSLEIVGITFHDPALRLVPTRRPSADRGFSLRERVADDGPDIILGMSQLRRLRIYLALREGMLYVTPATASVATPVSKAG
ncbi:MAG TPA: retropepsin-like aspartic protease [Aliidongia sp.]|nr:retropepsin-like aspartic protease [Aliidongia sp.]